MCEIIRREGRKTMIETAEAHLSGTRFVKKSTPQVEFLLMILDAWDDGRGGSHVIWEEIEHEVIDQLKRGDAECRVADTAWG